MLMLFSDFNLHYPTLKSITVVIIYFFEEVIHQMIFLENKEREIDRVKILLNFQIGSLIFGEHNH